MTTAQSHLSTKASRASLAFAPGVKDRSQSSEAVDQVDQVDQVHGWNILECHTGYAMLYLAIPSCFCSANADLFFSGMWIRFVLEMAVTNHIEPQGSWLRVKSE